MNKEDVVAFYTTKEVPYGAFSNFYRSPIDLDGKTWPTSEHYYQSRKTLDPKQQEMVRQALTPRAAAFLGREIVDLRPDWEEVKYNFMKVAVRAKFTQHKHLAKLLVETGDKEIVEWTEGTELSDSVWGNARDKNGNPGKNLLGKCLMEIRQELKAHPEHFLDNELDI